jgi:hypothetical protein
LAKNCTYTYILENELLLAKLSVGATYSAQTISDENEMKIMGSTSVFHACWPASSWSSQMTKEGVGDKQLQDARSASAKEQRPQPSQAKR